MPGTVAWSCILLLPEWPGKLRLGFARLTPLASERAERYEDTPLLTQTLTLILTLTCVPLMAGGTHWASAQRTLFAWNNETLNAWTIVAGVLVGLAGISYVRWPTKGRPGSHTNRVPGSLPSQPPVLGASTPRPRLT